MWFIIGIFYTYFGMCILNIVNEKTSGYLNLYQTETGFFSRAISAHSLQLFMVAGWPIVAITALIKYHWDTRNFIMPKFRFCVPYIYGMLSATFAGIGFAGILISLYAFHRGFEYAVHIGIVTGLVLLAAVLFERSYIMGLMVLESQEYTNSKKNNG